MHKSVKLAILTSIQHFSIGQILDQALILHIVYSHTVTYVSSLRSLQLDYIHHFLSSFWDDPLAAFTGNVPLSLMTHTVVAVSVKPRFIMPVY